MVTLVWGKGVTGSRLGRECVSGGARKPSLGFLGRRRMAVRRGGRQRKAAGCSRWLRAGPPQHAASPGGLAGGQAPGKGPGVLRERGRDAVGPRAVCGSRHIAAEPGVLCPCGHTGLCHISSPVSPKIRQTMQLSWVLQRLKHLLCVVFSL